MKKFYKLAFAFTMILAAFPTIKNVSDNANASNKPLEEYNHKIELPVGYTIYDYITFDGTNGGWQTGLYNAMGNYTFETTFRIEGITDETIVNKERYIFCSTQEAWNSNQTFLSYNLANYINYDYNWCGRMWYAGIQKDTWLLAKCDSDTFYLNSKACSRGGGVNRNYYNGEFLLFENFIGSFKYLKIWDGHTLLRYYIACSNASGKTGVYDLVNNTFVTNSTGNDCTGNPLNHDHQTYQNQIPCEYYLTDYAMGPASLDTGISGNNSNLSFDITFELARKLRNKQNAVTRLFSNYSTDAKNATDLGFEYVSNVMSGLRLNLNTKGSAFCSFGNDDFNEGKVNVKFGKKFGAILDGTECLSVSTLNSYINDESNQGETNNGNIVLLFDSYKTFKVYRFKIYDGDSLIRDYVPAFSITQQFGGMYDLVNNAFIGNAKVAYTTCQYCDSGLFSLSYALSDNDTLISSKGVMYLPASANYNSLEGLSFKEGTILSTLDGTSSITVSSGPLDLTELFGEMAGGVKYSLHVTENLKTYYFSFVKSASISSVSVRINTSLNNIHDDKQLIASGSMNKYSSSGSLQHSSTIEKFKGRGNISWSGNKRPYNVSIEDKLDLINCGVKSKKWAFIAHKGHGKQSGSDLYGFTELYSTFGDAVEMNYEAIDLFINGEYRGNYFLMERVTADRYDINKNEYDVEGEKNFTRIVQSSGMGIDTDGDDVPNQAAISGCSGKGGADDLPIIRSFHAFFDITNTVLTTKVLTEEEDLQDPAISSGIQAYQYATNSVIKENGYGGYIVEFARNWVGDLGDTSWFITRRGQAFALKSPECATKEQVQIISSYVQELEDALCNPYGFNSKGKYYADYIDIKSFAKQYAIKTMSCDVDFMSSSTFWYIDGESQNGLPKGKMYGDTIWDPVNGEISGVKFLFNKLIKNLRHSFYEENFLLHGDFVNQLYELTKKGTNFELKWKSFTTYSGPAFDFDAFKDFYEENNESFLMNDYLYGDINSNSYLIDRWNMARDFATRYDAWYEELFNPEINLLGVTSKRVKNGIDAAISANSKHSSVEWFKINDNGTQTKVDGASTTTLKPSEEGLYVAAVTGPNISHTSPSYALNTIIRNENITMVSNPVVFRTEKHSSDYDSLEDALEDTLFGDTLVLDKSFIDTSAYYSIKEGVTLDLNGYDVTGANAFLVEGQIIDTKSTKGIISAEAYLFGDAQSYLPIYDSANDGYSFFGIQIEDQITSSGKLQFRFKKDSEETHSAIDLISNDILGSHIKAMVTVSWVEDGMNAKQEFLFSDELMSKVIFGTTEEITYKRVFDFIINKLDETGIVGNVYMQCSFVCFNGTKELSRISGSKYYTSDLGQTWQQEV